DPDPLEDPGLVGADVEALQERVRDRVLGVEVAHAVEVQHQPRCSPPSTVMRAPLTQRASSVASRQMKSATSAGVVRRPDALRRRAAARRCWWPGMSASAGVGVTPAWTTLARMPCGAHSTAIARTAASSAALAAATAA